MARKKKLVLAAKKILAVTMAVATFALSGYGMELRKEVVAEAAASNVLSSDDRGVIYANSRSDFRDETIYFVITTRFYDGDSSNNARTSEDDNKAHNPEDDPSWRGDFKGLIDKLDYIKALGFTAVWITPVVENASGYDYHGYHAYNFNAVDTRYESNGVTYQDLIDAVHAKGMKLIQDVVLNHTCNWGEENLLQLTSDIYSERNQAVMNGSNDPDNIYHHNGFCGGGDWDNYSAQNKTIADDCFDLETENPTVYNYLIDAYTKYIKMGVDAFRVDTVKHISRLTFNSTFLPAFQAAGGSNFYMFGEVCTKGHDVWYRDCPPISTAFYTWADSDSWTSRWSTDLDSNEALVEEHYAANMNTSAQPTSNNAFLNGNDYHTPDYSQKSGMDVIDFQMHWSFMNANSAFNTAKGEDKYFNDSTWNVVYVDSHDYAPDECQTTRYTGGTDAWAENLSLMFTFRGIPCVYYGSEIEFQKGKPIDVGPNAKLSETGRAYYGDNIEGTVATSDFTVFGDLSGQVADTLSQPLSQHIMRLNRLRQAIPALRKGQYSTDGCSGNMAFKRRYTDDKTDSFALVAISGSATFTGVPNGKYVDAVTGDVKNVTNGTLSASVSGQGNMKVYVLDTAKTPAPGRVVTNGKYLTDGGAIEDIGAVDIQKIEPTSITLSKKSVSLLEATSETVTATIAPSDATNKTVTWSTSDAAVATVSGGKITGIAPGTATITAKTSNKLTATVSVTVSTNPNIVKPTGITVSTKAVSIEEGSTSQVTATVLPATATNKTVTWSSANKAIATVDSNGNITAVAEGSTTITASTFNGHSATVTVTVTAKEITYIEHGVYFEKPASWGDNISAYLFSNNQTVGNAWPGTAMTAMGNGVYSYEYATTDSALMVIFTDGQGHQTADLSYTDNGYYNSSGLVKIIYPVEKGKVIVNYVDESGNVLSTSTIKGEVGSAYSTSAQTFSGYTLKTTPANATGTYTSSDITVTYVYSKAVKELAISVSGNTSVDLGAKLSLTASAEGGSGSYTYSYVMHNLLTDTWYRFSGFTNDKTLSWTAGSEGTREIFAEVKDGTGKVVRSAVHKVTVNAGTVLSVTGSADSSVVTKGTKVNFSANATGGKADYKYKFVIHNTDTNQWFLLKDFSDSNAISWVAGSEGNRNIYVDVKDSTGKVVRSAAINVKVASENALRISASGSSSNVGAGATVLLAASAAGGSGSYAYKYIVHNLDTNQWFLLSDFSPSMAISWVAGSTGRREFYVDAKDGTGTIVRSAAINVTVS